MKTKIVLGLAVCCLLSALVGAVVTNSVQAQAPSPVISGWPFSVNFVEDPFRMHGLQIVDAHETCLSKVEKIVYTVPTGCRLIVTDICTNEDSHVVIEDGSVNCLNIDLNDKNARQTSFRSGIVFTESVNVNLDTGNPPGAHITISGYLVDL